MKKIPYKSRFDPQYEATLDELFLNIKFIPFRGNNVQQQPPGWLHMSHHTWPNRPLFGWVYVEASDLLIEMIDSRSIFDGSRSVISRDHCLEMIWRSDGKIFLYQKFQQIVGSYNLCEVAEAELVAWVRRAVAGQELPEHAWLEG